MTDITNGEWHFIGKHGVRFEPPDLIFSRPDGDMSVDEHLQLIKFVQCIPQPPKGLIGLIDAGKGGRVDPAAMKMPEVRQHSRNHRAVVYFNARFYHRTIIALFQRVNKILKISDHDIPIMIFDTEAEARAWVDTFRNQG